MNYYRQSPAWGTSAFEFPRPPAPAFQPQPNWHGSDFYNAHAGPNPDPSMYQNAWGSVRQYASGVDGEQQGVGAHEAKHWHKRAYGGFSDVNSLLPAEVGHAAAYEAYRSWVANSDLYEPLSGDIDRQREGLVGLAVAEAARLLQFTNSSMDQYARMESSDAAAATASILFYRYLDKQHGGFRQSRSRTRRASVGSYEEDDPYASDLLALANHHQSHSRHRSHSRSPMMYPSQTLGAAAPMAIPGATNGYGMGTPYPSSAQLPPPMSSSPYSSSAVGMMPGAQTYGPGPAYGSLHANYGSTAMPTQTYSVPSAVPMGTRPRSTSMSMPGYYGGHRQVHYATPAHVQAPYRSVQVQPQVVLAGSGHRKHHHHHRSKKHHKRSRSIGY